MHYIFVYGTLLFPEIVQRLTGKLFKNSPAVLSGFKRFQVKDSEYPAIIEFSGSKVDGIVLENVDEKSFQVLTFYEGDEYVCMEKSVLLGENEIVVKVFIWNGGAEKLMNTDWNVGYFKKNYLNIYLDKVLPETVRQFKRHS